MTISGIEAREIQIVGRQMRCQMCDYTRFLEREARLNTSVFGFDLSNTKATCLVCERCGFVHWFLPTRGHHHGDDTYLQEELASLREDLDALGELTQEVEVSQDVEDGVLSG